MKNQCCYDVNVDFHENGSCFSYIECVSIPSHSHSTIALVLTLHSARFKSSVSLSCFHCHSHSQQRCHHISPSGTTYSSLFYFLRLSFHCYFMLVLHILYAENENAEVNRIYEKLLLNRILVRILNTT